ncbi:MAG: hypothetical protein FJ403_11145 [Verrucomicrobia bacterium]|nr:hypothetical protein [Verrucomicrobiota bacterium]
MKQSNGPWNFRRLLAAGLIFTAVSWGIVLAAGLFWFSSIREKAWRTEEQTARARATRIVPFDQPRREPIQVARPPDLEADPGKSANAPPPVLTEPTPVVQPPLDIVERVIPRSNTLEARSQPGDDIFKDLVIPHLRIQIPATGIMNLRGRPRSYVRATIREGDIVYTNVAIRLKGGQAVFKP